GEILIAQGASSATTYEKVSGDVALTSGGVATVNGISGIGVSTTDPTSNQVLEYNSSTKLWTPTTLSIPTYTANSPLSISNSNEISLSGTVPVANGGTGATSLTAHGIVLGEGTSAATASAAMT